MQTVRITSLWRSPRQNVSSSIFIPVKNEPTRTRMNANRQRLPNHLPAIAALLGSILWINQNDLAAGAFSLAGKDGDKAAPRGIADTAGQPAVLEHVFHAQAFRSDDPVSVDQRPSNFVVHVPADVSHLGVKYNHARLHGLTTIAATLATSESTLTAAQFGESGFERAGITKAFAVRRSDKRFQSNVDANCSGGWCSLGVRYFTGEYREPLTGLSRDVDLLYPRPIWQLAVPADANGADVLESQPAFAYRCSVGIAIRKGAKGINALESGTPRHSACLESSEECDVRLIEFPQRLHCGIGVYRRQVLVGSPPNREPSALLHERPIHASRFPTEHLAIECGIVQSTMGFESTRKFSLLVGVCK